MAGAKFFVWYELQTSAVEAAKTFYRKVLGWDLQDMPMQGGTYTIFNVDGAGVGGLMQLTAPGVAPFWSPYIEVDDVDAGAAKVGQLGGEIRVPPMDIPNVGRFAVVADPQGSHFNLFKSLNSGTPGISLQPGKVGWHELHAKDWESALKFYEAMFGWKKSERHDMGPMGIYQIFDIEGSRAGAAFNSPAAGNGGYWLLYFNVADIDTAHRLLGEAGGTVLNGPMQVPGGSWIIQAADPQGAQFALFGPRKG
jgi:predicted enzyme related to lactoylglutathione lyase